MKTIMFFGDSNTWGYDPLTSGRYSEEIRFTGILSKKLSGCLIIEEGLKGRTTVIDDCLEDGRNGLKALPMLLCSHDPLDIVVVMLGTNDVKRKFQLSAAEIAKGMERLVKTIQMPQLWDGSKIPEILIVCPAGVTEDFEGDRLEAQFDLSSVAKSKALHHEYQQLADKYRCQYLNAMEYTGPGKSDGVHLEAAEHKKLAEALEEKLKTML